MWILLLNDMRSAHFEHLEPVACAETREALEAFVARERVPGYQDGRWAKSFRQGGPLEWYNQPRLEDSPGVVTLGDRPLSYVDLGTREEFLQRAVTAMLDEATAHFDHLRKTLPVV